MKCEICHLNEAVCALERMVDGEKRELYVCHACAKTSAAPAHAPGAGDRPGHSLTDILFSLGMPIEPGNGKVKDSSCPVCGMSRAELRKNHRMGCPKCFEVFETDIRTFLSEQVPVTERTRKTPSQARMSREELKLKMDLAKAVMEERYEDAAKLSAELEALRKKGEGRG